MNEFRNLRPGVRAYVALVVTLGAAALASSVHSLYTDPIGEQWLVLAVLTLLTGSFSVKVPSINAHISVSETFVFASVLLFGAPAGTVTVLLECLIIILWMKPQGRPAYRILFNMAAPAVAIWVSGTTFYLVAGIKPYSRLTAPLPGLEELFIPLLAFTALYFLLNSWLVAIAVGLENSKSPTAIWWKNFAWLSVNYFSGASLAALIVTYTRTIDISTLVIIVPLLVVSYLTFRTAMGRAEDSYNHLSEVNRLYLSTIETLAMAIDAKDQITHGHIRRVQAYAVGLAKRVGVTDETLVKAIEAAALLHDMGKLAVPEYILNKPGKLTEAEFEKMKLHASAGADILSSIEFPYPVVPIVRHHHENWDGTGYPAQLKGTDIPIGARILSVVDCFDALTSDRPYRPRLSDRQALEILVNRRGSMYDPLVVDTFLQVHTELVAEPVLARLPSHALNEITNSITLGSGISRSLSHLEDINVASDEVLTLTELARSLAGLASVEETAGAIANHLRRLIPFTQSVLFLYEISTDEIVAQQASAGLVGAILGLRIPLGQRLSGWVGANRKTILNSDPALDLGDVARNSDCRLLSCLSTPLVSGDRLIGVLTLYSPNMDGFTDRHQRVVEAAAKQISLVFRYTSGQEQSTSRDPLTSLPRLEYLEQLVRSTSGGGVIDRSLALLCVTVVRLKAVSIEHGRAAGDTLLLQVVTQIRGCLKETEVLFWHGAGEFVVVFDGSDTIAAEALAFRVRECLNGGRCSIDDGRSIAAVEIDVSVVRASHGGLSLPDLVTSAKLRLSARAGKDAAPSVH